MHVAPATPTDTPPAAHSECTGFDDCPWQGCPGPHSRRDRVLDVVVQVLRAAGGWRVATEAGNQVRAAQGLDPISIRQMERELRKAGRLEKFPHPPRTWGRPGKPPLTEAECKLAVEVRPGAPGGKSWDDTVDLVNAGRAPEDRISERLLRDRLLELGLWRPGQWAPVVEATP